jgi:hypothetical protein
LFRDDLAALKERKANYIHFYESRDTDALVLQLEGMPEVEKLSTEGTDLRAAGMASISKLPRLRKLVLYRDQSIDEAAIAKLKGMTSLTELTLTNIDLNNDSLRSIGDIPNLKKLSIIFDTRTPMQMPNDDGLAHLANLTKLETFAVSGGWYSNRAIEDLRKKLPNCAINGVRAQ